MSQEKPSAVVEIDVASDERVIVVIDNILSVGISDAVTGTPYGDPRVLEINQKGIGPQIRIVTENEWFAKASQRKIKEALIAWYAYILEKNTNETR